jgi:hypothetical protein
MIAPKAGICQSDGPGDTSAQDEPIQKEYNKMANYEEVDEVAAVNQ